MERASHRLHWQTLPLYLNDEIVIAPDFETYLQRLEEVFQQLRQSIRKISLTKCKLLQFQLRYLAHIVSSEGVATDPAKVKVVERWPIPQGVWEVQGFLGTVGYYRQYISRFATIAKLFHHWWGRRSHGDGPARSKQHLKPCAIALPLRPCWGIRIRGIPLSWARVPAGAE